MKLGVTAWKITYERDGMNLGMQAQIAEKLGFDSFWLPENHFSGPLAIPSPLMLLANVASVTNRIKLGSTSYLLPIRNPILAAEEVAVLDQLSNGRVILGIGRGFQNDMFKAFEVPTSQKRKIFKKNLDLMISAWLGEPISILEDKEILLSPLPVQKPFPTIWIAAFGPLALKQAGDLGLPYLASPVETFNSLKANLSEYRKHLVTEDNGLSTKTPLMRTIFISENKEACNKVKVSLAKENAARFRTEETRVDNWAIVGPRNYVLEELNKYVEELGIDYFIARGRIPRIDDRDQIKSHEALTEIFP
ncbi:MAG: hypothetical protein CMQ27_01840 [Gammaproteobacteria bacterium]|nr:hypothetical protein [Gammaproteobacteria bacterium]